MSKVYICFHKYFMVSKSTVYIAITTFCVSPPMIVHGILLKISFVRHDPSEDDLCSRGHLSGGLETVAAWLRCSGATAPVSSGSETRVSGHC